MSVKVPFQNVYAHRTAATESACFVCGKSTNAVLTHKDLDFFYVCVNHIKDSSFCKPVPVIENPAEKLIEKPKDLKKSSSDKPSKDTKSDDQTGTEDKPSTEESKVPENPAPPKQPQQPKEYILDSKMFYLRTSAYRKKIELSQAKKIGNSIPTVPKNNFK